MKPQHGGWTLVEVLVSTVIVMMLLAVMATSLGTAQRSWLAVRVSADLQRSADQAQDALRMIRHATLQPRQRYNTSASIDQSLSFVEPTSDFHFVCGPAIELLPGVPGTCGDAVFFQMSGTDGDLQTSIRVCGLYIQYGDDSAWRPSLLHNSPPLRRFRLFRLSQPASSMPLFQSASAGGPPTISRLNLRPDLYAWFVTPIINSTPKNPSTAVVAENVVAMIIQARPGYERCYDTRRRQWAGATDAAKASLHRLPQFIDLAFVVTDEADWARLPEARAMTVAQAIKAKNLAESPGLDTSTGMLTHCREWLEEQGFHTRLVRMSLPLEEADP